MNHAYPPLHDLINSPSGDKQDLVFGWACKHFVPAEDPTFCANCGDLGSFHECGGAFQCHRIRSQYGPVPKPTS